MADKQGICLVGQDGHLYMDVYDQLIPKARLRLANSKFNICSACVMEELMHNKGNGAIEIIDVFEDHITRNQPIPYVGYAAAKARSRLTCTVP